MSCGARSVRPRKKGPHEAGAGQFRGRRWHHAVAAIQSAAEGLPVRCTRGRLDIFGNRDMICVLLVANACFD